MSSDPQTKAPSDGLSDQERRYVQSKDPSKALLQELKAAVAKFVYDKSGSKTVLGELVKSNPYLAIVPPALEYELPSEIEEFFTLRSKRFEIQLFSGIHETQDGDFISVVMLAVPIMGWEIIRLDEDMIKDGKAPDWANGWTDEDLETFCIDLEGVWSEENLQSREILPIMAKAVDDPYEDTTGYSRRREALIGALKFLCSQFPFTIHFSETGNIPKEVPDEWIHGPLLEEYNKHIARVDARLKEDQNELYSLYEKAGLLMGRDHFDEAKVLLDCLIKLEPNLPYAWFAISDIYSRTGKDDEADKAEEKAMELERLLVGRRPGKADVYDFTPPFSRVGPEWAEDERSASEGAIPVCDNCGNEFLHVTDGFWYTCNMCGRSSPLKGKGIGLSIKTEKEEFRIGEPIWMTIDIENLTDQELTYSTDDLELISMPPTDTVEDDGEDEPARDYVMDWIGKLKGPYANGVIKPHAKESLRIDLRKIETLEPSREGDDDEDGAGSKGPFEVPGEHRVSVFLKVTIGRIEDGKEPWAETEPIRISIKGK